MTATQTSTAVREFGELARGDEAGEPGSHDDHAVGSSPNGAHQAALSVQTMAMSFKAARVASGMSAPSRHCSA